MTKRARTRTPLAQTLFDLRDRTGLTQEKFAAEHGFNQSAMSKWERGKIEPKVSNLLQLAKAHGRDISTLVVGVDPDYDAVFGKRSGGMGSAEGEALQHGAGNQADQARVLKVRTDALRRIVRDVQRVTASLIQSAQAGQEVLPDEEDRGASGGATRARGGPRRRR